MGIVRWHVTNDAGDDVMIELEAYLLPKFPARLLSPQQLAKNLPSPSFPVLLAHPDHSILSGEKQNHSTHFQSTNPLHRKMNVTVAHTAVLCAFLDKATTQRLTKEQEELLQIHRKLGHMPMQLIQKLAWTCTPCTAEKMRNSIVRGLRLQPGDEISTDQLESSVGGRQIYGNGNLGRSPNHAGNVALVLNLNRVR